MTGAARDGSPVELYARMPTFGEPELVHATIPPATHILELGAGAGRMTHGLLALGHPVTAVDSSAEMLAHVRGATTVHAEIEGLDLRREFGCVLLASQLVNVDDDAQRAAFLETCARHVAPNGLVLIQRYDPVWAAEPTPSDREHDGVRIRITDPRRDGERLHATVEYEADGRRWRHGPFTSRILDDSEIEARLLIAGLSVDHWLDERRTWVAARLAADVSALYVEIPEAEPLVADARRRWDTAGSAVPAHVTVLFPFLSPDRLDAGSLGALAEVASTIAPFEVTFARHGRFPSVLWLAPEPAAPFRALTEAVVERWPDHPPYGGAFDEVTHHLTVAEGAPPDVMSDLADRVSARLPISARVDRLTLSARIHGVWSIRGRFELGPAASEHPAGTKPA